MTESLCPLRAVSNNSKGLRAMKAKALVLLTGKILPVFPFYQ